MRSLTSDWLHIFSLERLRHRVKNVLVISMHAAQIVKENKLYEARTAYKYAIQYI